MGQQLQPLARDPRLKDVRHTLTLVDGTLLQGLPVLVQAALSDPRTAKYQAKVRLHTQFDLERAVPIRIDVTQGVSRGEADERAVLGKALEAGHCYVEDRGYAKFKLFNEIVAAQSSYVCRLRDNSRYEIEQQRPLTAEDSEAGIILDAVVRLGEYEGAKNIPTIPFDWLSSRPRRTRSAEARPATDCC